MKIVRLATSLGLAGVMLLSSVPLHVGAQEDTKQGVTVSPSFQELVIGPGLIEAKTTVKARNNTGGNLTAQIRLVDFDALGEFGSISFGQDGTPLTKYSLVERMSVPNGKTVQLPASQEVEIPITIKNDDQLAPGGHYGAVIISVNNEQKPGSSQVAFKQELASLLFVKKTGGEVFGLELELMEAINVSKTPETVNLKFKSTGNVHAVPRGYVEVTDPSGKVVSKGIINPESTLILPDKSRQFTTIMQPVAEAKAKGTYKITAYYRYDGVEDFITKSIIYERGNNLVSTGIIMLVVGTITGVASLIYMKKDRILPKFKKLLNK